jgi:hypothetical protein
MWLGVEQNPKLREFSKIPSHLSDQKQSVCLAVHLALKMGFRHHAPEIHLVFRHTPVNLYRFLEAPS